MLINTEYREAWNKLTHGSKQEALDALAFLYKSEQIGSTVFQTMFILLSREGEEEK